MKIKFLIGAVGVFFTLTSQGLDAARLKEIEKIAMSISSTDLVKGVQLTENPEYTGLAGSRELSKGSYQVVINPTILNPYGVAAKNFTLFHEYGHIHLGHLPIYFDNKDMAATYELEADAFASYLTKRYEMYGPELENFLKAIEERTQTVPPGPVRIALIKQILGVP